MKRIRPLLIPAIFIGACNIFFTHSISANDFNRNRRFLASPLMMIGRPYNEGSPYEKSRQEETPQDTSADAATRTALECQDAEMQQIRRDRETSGDIEDTENQTELQNTGANRDTVAPNRDRLTLSHFRVALNADPEAERFIISTRNGIYFIESKEANPFTSDLNRDEDIKVMSALQELIQFETTNNLLQDYRSTTTSSDPLSAARLRDILERIPVIKIIRRPVAQEEIPIESDEDTSIGLNLDDEDTPLFHTEVESFAKIEGKNCGRTFTSEELKIARERAEQERVLVEGYQRIYTEALQEMRTILELRKNNSWDFFSADFNSTVTDSASEDTKEWKNRPLDV